MLSKKFQAFAAGACLLALAGCDDDPKLRGELQPVVAAIQANSQNNVRVTQFVNDLSRGCVEKEVRDECQYYLADGKPHYQFLASHHIRIELAQDLPLGAAVQVFRDRIRVDTLLPKDVQEAAFTRALAYMEQQEKDSQPYGIGESFTIGAGDLVRIGKNSYAREQILLPSAP